MEFLKLTSEEAGVSSGAGPEGLSPPGGAPAFRSPGGTRGRRAEAGLARCVFPGESAQCSVTVALTVPLSR